MLTIALGLSAACCYSLYNLMSQRLLRRVSWMTISVAMFATALVLLAAPALLLDGLSLDGAHLPDLALAALGGGLYTVATATFLLALRVGKLSLVVVLACLDGAFAASISIALGERLTGLAVVGLVLAAGGGLLAAAEHDPPSESAGGRWRLAAGGGLALLCSGAMTGVFLAYGRIDAFSPFTTVTVASAAALLVMLPIAAAAGVLLPAAGSVRGVVAVSLLDMLAFLAGTAALALGPVSVASVLQAQTATISTALGLLLLHERPAWWQTVGVLCTIAGVSVLAWAM